ncbi:MAG: hypothetical protein ACYDCK_12610 [Thermoplasmatota archaeon]
MRANRVARLHCARCGQDWTDMANLRTLCPRCYGREIVARAPA